MQLLASVLLRFIFILKFKESQIFIFIELGNFPKPYFNFSWNVFAVYIYKNVSRWEAIGGDGKQ